MIGPLLASLLAYAAFAFAWLLAAVALGRAVGTVLRRIGTLDLAPFLIHDIGPADPVAVPADQETRLG